MVTRWEELVWFGPAAVEDMSRPECLPEPRDPNVVMAEELVRKWEAAQRYAQRPEVKRRNAIAAAYSRAGCETGGGRGRRVLQRRHPGCAGVKLWRCETCGEPSVPSPLLRAARQATRSRAKPAFPAPGRR